MEHRPKHGLVLGASRPGGTGWAIAEAVARIGLHVSVGARTREGIEALASAIRGTPIGCDATIESEVERMVGEAVDRNGLIDAAVLAAGGGVKGTIDGIPTAELQRAFTLNFFAPVFFLRHVARRMRDGGSIVLISSVSATNAWPGYFAYGSAKAAVHALVKYAALEYAPRGIRVNAVCPGPIETPAASALLTNASLRAALAREVPLGDASSTDVVAEAAAWFATQAHFVTGEWLHVDGGLHLRRPPFPDELAAAARASA